MHQTLGLKLPLAPKQADGGGSEMEGAKVQCAARDGLAPGQLSPSSIPPRTLHKFPVVEVPQFKA
eukprot:6455028-Amphidinium_carterae.2